MSQQTYVPHYLKQQTIHGIFYLQDDKPGSPATLDDRHEIEPNFSRSVPRDAFLDRRRHNSEPVATTSLTIAGRGDFS